jgi:hypothetical protein
MRPIYSQLTVAAIVIGFFVIALLYHRANVLKAQIKKAEEKTPQSTNQPVANTSFKPVESQA